MFTVLFMCLWLSLGDTMADPIEPLVNHKVVDDGDDVTLSCSYKGFSGSFADKIGPKDEDANIVKKETDSVTLKCSYETNSEYILLYWYKQYPNSAPQFLLYKAARSNSGQRKPTDTRFATKTSRDSTELTIGGLKLSDSALYLCALRVGTQ
ncbi:uncharacterized protein LOC113636507 [Tachysurus ichikawai]